MSTYIIGNWKMHFTLAESTRLAADISDGFDKSESEIVVCPSFTSLYAVRDVLEDSKILLGAQDVFYETKGAFTGEISPGMLADAGCKYVIVGHSERRHLGDRSDDIRRKLVAALEVGIKPIVCVGESLADRKAGTGGEFVTSQLRSVLRDVSVKDFIVAYEPIWAIGTGEEAKTDKVVPMLDEIKKTLTKLNLTVPILYGGSVDGENAKGFIDDGFDGVLVGTSSWKSDSFLAIIKAIEK